MARGRRRPLGLSPLGHQHPTQRYRAHYHNGGLGHVYQSRFKSFPVQDDPHLLVLCRYVERNALRAGLAETAQQWRWSSLWRREHAQDAFLSPWPLERPSDWLTWVNEPQSQAELEAVRRSVARSSPFGSDPWRQATAQRLGLDATLRPRGRPRKRKPCVAQTKSTMQLDAAT